MSDWYGGSANQGEAIYGLDRIKRGNGSGYSADAFDGRTNFRIFEYILAADKSKKTSGITFTSTQSGRIPTILGIAKKGYKPANPDAIEAVKAEQPAVQTAVYSVSGMKLDKMQRGVNIVRSSDGVTRKVLVK